MEENREEESIVTKACEAAVELVMLFETGDSEAETKFEDYCSTLYESITQEKSQISELEDEYEMLKTGVTTKLLLLQESSEANDQLHAKSKEVSDKLAQKELEVKDAESAIKDQEEIPDPTNLLEQIGHLIDQEGKLKEKISELDGGIAKASDCKSSLEEELQEIQKSIDRLEIENTKMLKKSKQKQKDLETKISRFSPEPKTQPAEQSILCPTKIIHKTKGADELLRLKNQLEEVLIRNGDLRKRSAEIDQEVGKMRDKIRDTKNELRTLMQ